MGGGPPEDIKEFFLSRVGLIDYVGYPFPHADFNYIYVRRYLNGFLLKESRFPIFMGPEWLQYLQHFFLTLFIVFIARSKYTLCFALDDLSVLSVVLFRWIRRIEKLVYYSIDYTPVRFKNLILNHLYHLADRLSCRYSDVVWVVAKHMVQAREENGVDVEKGAPFVEVPIGFHRNEINLQPLRKVDMFHLVFVGILWEKQGLQIVLDAMPQISKRFPKVHLTIIGTGEYESVLKRKAVSMGLNKEVAFLGFIRNHREIEDILTKAGVGLAPYKPDPTSVTYFADPAKIKLYLGCGLPIVTTSVPAISGDLEKNKAGVVVSYTSEDFCKAVFRLLGNAKLYSLYRNNAIRMSKEFDIDNILASAVYSL